MGRRAPRRLYHGLRFEGRHIVNVFPGLNFPLVALNVGSLRCRNLSGVGGRPDSSLDITKTALMTQSCRYRPPMEAVATAARTASSCDRCFAGERSWVTSGGLDQPPFDDSQTAERRYPEQSFFIAILIRRYRYMLARRRAD
jgi:hypothetical protein